MGILDDFIDLFGGHGTPYGEAPTPTSDVFGTDRADRLFGEANSDDNIYAYDGNDYINAYSGDDVIYGGAGDDTIRGGPGVDYMRGGGGSDEFRISTGDSGRSWDDADIIWDFMTGDTGDWISFDNNGLTSPDALVGTPGNYVEREFLGDGTYEGTYNLALELAKKDIGHNTDGHDVFFAFYTDGEDGYLFADTNFNGIVDTGIELRGLTSRNDFSWLDIQ